MRSRPSLTGQGRTRVRHEARRFGLVRIRAAFGESPFPGRIRLVTSRAAMADAADFRRIALFFDGTAEYPHFDRRAFKARVTFATLAPDELIANIKLAPDEQALKCAVAPDAFEALDNAS